MRNHVVCSINRASLKINETVLGFVIFLITETKKRFLDKRVGSKADDPSGSKQTIFCESGRYFRVKADDLWVKTDDLCVKADDPG